ncbi:MAG: HAD family phosphatase [Oscillospiraceae bacterium]|nr:HAD family phosphatase [Oscillospiraceae bacterium]
MESRQRLIFFDIDGTIQAEEDGVIPESTKEAIAMLRENGHKTFINTGRTAMNVRDDIRSLGFDGYVYGCGTEVEIGGRRIFRRTTDPELCVLLANAVRSCGAAPLYERSDAMFLDSKARMLPGMQKLLDLYKSQGLKVGDLHESDDFSYDKFVIWYDNETDMPRFRRLIDGIFVYINRGYGFAEMLPIGSGKAEGIKMIRKELKVRSEDVIAIGDSLNDADMLKAAGLGIAMGGAELLYPYADYITKELKNDGLAHALRKYFLI